MKHRIRTAALLAAALPLALGACDDSSVSSPNGDDANFSVVFAPEAASSALMAPVAIMGPGSPARGTMSMSNVDSLVLPIGDVEAREADTGDWVAAGSIDQDVDLLNLPADGIELVDSNLPQGSYSALRFWLTDEATITILEPITVGRTTFESGTYTLVIPSADNNGVRLHADFDVTEDGQVLTVLVDGDATVRKVIATGSGVLKIAPVLTVRNQNGEDVGDVDDDEDADDEDDGDDDGEDEEETEGMVASVDVDAGTFTLGDTTVVQVTDETEITGDLLTLQDVADALANEEMVEVEVYGPTGDDGVITATRVEFEVEDDDGDGDVDDEDDGEVEKRGRVIDMDRDAMSFRLYSQMDTVNVVMNESTELDLEDGMESWDDVVDAHESGTQLRAEVEGEWTDTGDLLAWEVEIDVMDGGNGGGEGGQGGGGMGGGM